MDKIVISIIILIILYYVIYNKLKDSTQDLEIIDRLTFQEKIDPTKLSLEIGALNNPIFEPKLYPNLKFIDVFSTEQLKQNYKDHPDVDINTIVNVDYVWKGQKYIELIPDVKFEQVFSSHNIEHQPNLIEYLNNISSVLNPGGLVYLVIPDKRYCFDHYIEESNIIDILSADIRQDKKPQISTLFKAGFQSTHNEPERHWNNDFDINKLNNLNDVNTINILTEKYNHLKSVYNFNKYSYIDTHVWQFTPKSFIININVLNSMKIIDLNIIYCSDTKHDEFEFYTILQKK